MVEPVNGDEIRKIVLRVLNRVVPESAGEEVDPATPFRDQFEMDSLDFLNFVLAVEKEFGVSVPDAAYPRLGNLDGSVEFIGLLLAKDAG
jgi:acyl carrier protein